MGENSLDSLQARRELVVGDKCYTYYGLQAVQDRRLGNISRLPFSLKVLLENVLRNEDGRSVTVDDIQASVAWAKERHSSREIAYPPFVAKNGRGCQGHPVLPIEWKESSTYIQNPPHISRTWKNNRRRCVISSVPGR